MKRFTALGLAFLLVAGGLAEAQRSGREVLTELTVDADAQEAFFAKYPDLTDERDLVAATARELAKEGGFISGETAAAELAARAREKLGKRTPREWQRKAVSLFPELGVAGSEFNMLFLKHHRELQRSSPQYMEEPSWPVLLAKRCADELRTGSASPAARPAADAQPAAGAKTSAASAKTPSKISAWLAVLSVILLAGILWLPARWMWRVSQAFGRKDETVTLWQRALYSASWAYLFVSFVGLFRTFRANVDLGWVDRFGITLLVSLLAGIAIAVPVFFVAWGVVWWQRGASVRTAARVAAGPAGARDLPAK